MRPDRAMWIDLMADCSDPLRERSSSLKITGSPSPCVSRDGLESIAFRRVHQQGLAAIYSHESAPPPTPPGRRAGNQKGVRCVGGPRSPNAHRLIGRSGTRWAMGAGDRMTSWNPRSDQQEWRVGRETRWERTQMNDQDSGCPSYPSASCAPLSRRTS